MAVYAFGNFELDTRTGELRRQRTRVRLRPQPCAALVYLIERPGQFICRQELHRALWPEGTFVRFEDGLNSCIKQIRAALGDSRTAPHFLETLTRRGYRFIAPVTAMPDRRASGPRGGLRTRVLLLPVRDLDAAASPSPSSSSVPNARNGNYALAEGLGEELSAQLALAAPREIAVITAAIAEGNTASDEAASVASDYTLATSLRAAGLHARVTAQLIDTSTRQHAWAGRFDLWLDEPLDAQASVAEQIVRGIVATIRESLADADDEDVEGGVDVEAGRMNGGRISNARSAHRSEGVTTHGA